MRRDSPLAKPSLPGACDAATSQSSNSPPRRGRRRLLAGPAHLRAGRWGGGAGGGATTTTSTTTATTTSTSSGTGGGACVRTVNGTETEWFLANGGMTATKPDLSGAKISILAGPSTLTGTGNTNGTFSVSDVPCGEYYLTYLDPGATSTGATVYYLTSSGAPDMSRWVAGRSNVTAMTMSTPVTVSLTDLDPWANSDSHPARLDQRGDRGRGSARRHGLRPGVRRDRLHGDVRRVAGVLPAEPDRGGPAGSRGPLPAREQRAGQHRVHDRRQERRDRRLHHEQRRARDRHGRAGRPPADQERRRSTGPPPSTRSSRPT